MESPPPWLDGGPPRMENPPPGWMEEHPPRWRPPRMENPPPGKQTPAYGLGSAGMHPTGMHSCFVVRSTDLLICMNY